MWPELVSFILILVVTIVVIVVVYKYIFNKGTTTFSDQATANRKKELKTLKDGNIPKILTKETHEGYVKTQSETHRVARKPVQPYIETLKKENQELKQKVSDQEEKIEKLNKKIDSLQEQINLAKTQMEDEIVQRLEHEGKLCFENCVSLAIRWICNNKIEELEKFPGCASQLEKIITVHADRNKKLVNEDLECRFFMETLVNHQIVEGVANCLIVDEMMDVQTTAAWEKLMTVDGSVVIFATLFKSGVTGHVVVYDLDTRTERTKDGKVMMCDPKDPNNEQYQEMDFQEFKKQVVGCDELRLYSVNLDKLCEIIVENKDYLHNTEKTFYNAPLEN